VIDLDLPKIIVAKLQTIITFDREVRWRRVKNESCSKRGNKSSYHAQRELAPLKFQKSIIYYHFLKILVLFGYFLGILRF